ncbi:B3 domain-containing protein [Quillaja saponaria]|uniref:B3 domain-containing protein n=1 Tax=Quillaja saponaria TaxID=32244 RepID=A0AAD7QJM3_QUISA|nr:B3 domain-containing protein [Quillaja saponaria]
MSKSHRSRVSSCRSNSRALVAPPSLPTFFFKIIFPYNIEEKKLRIPRKFVRDFGHELSAVATIKGPDGRIWRMSIKNSEEDTWFRDGWHEFVNYYSVGVKYMILFVYGGNSQFQASMTDHQTCTQIHFHPYNDQSTHEEENDEENIEETIISDDEDSNDTSTWSKLNENVISKPANPSFEVKLVYDYFVYLNADFASKYLNTQQEHIKLQMDGKQWPASLYVASSGKKIGRGWKTFAHDNNLKIGDVCVFELINRKEIVLEVKVSKILRKRGNPMSQQNLENAASKQYRREPERGYEMKIKRFRLENQAEIIELYNCETSNDEMLNRNVISKPHNSAKKNKNGRRSCSSSKPREIRVESATKCMTKNPSFTAVLGPSNRNGCYLYVPADFTDKYMNTREGSIQLELEWKAMESSLLF